MTEAVFDLTRLLRLRLAVARFGEMDRAKWWNTKGLLAGLGEMALSRGFPKSHPLARARAVFSVAAHRCHEVFDPPQGITLWKLPPEVEDRFEGAWAEWLDNISPWADFLTKVDDQKHADLLEVLERRHDSADESDWRAFGRLAQRFRQDSSAPVRSNGA